MRISVLGLGYVGSVSAACLARDGHSVIGVDINRRKVEEVAAGRSPIIEAGLDGLLAEVVKAGRLRASVDSRWAVHNSDVSVVCVGTPSSGNGKLNLQYVERVCSEIGSALADRRDYCVVVIRSTVLPGTVRGRLLPLLETHSGKRAGEDFGVCMNPEFLREGTAIDDYYHPSQIVVGELDHQSGEVVSAMYEAVDAPEVRTSIETAETLKYVNNAFHALKIAFANEVSNLCEAHGVDGAEVMDIFVKDLRLNISPAYLKPGFAFGGSCLPKDLRALTYRAKELDLDCPLLSAIEQSNHRQIRRGIELVESKGFKKIGVLGLSFKPGTDDVRESPSVPLVETLLGRGYQVSVYDDKVDPEMLVGANKTFLERELPHIASLMRSSIDEVLSEAEVVVVANSSASFRDLRYKMRAGQLLVDLVGITRNEAVRQAEHGKAA